jgi:hypothetical protein
MNTCCATCNSCLHVSSTKKPKRTSGLVMKFVCAFSIFIVLIAVACFSAINVSAQRSADAGAPTSAKSRVTTTQSPSVGGPQLIQPEELVNILKSAKGPKPLVIQAGFRVLYLQAHIPGSEYIGPASSAEGIRQLRKRVEALPRTQSLLLYCGCCPWSECPNVSPAYKELRTMGFQEREGPLHSSQFRHGLG